MADRGEDGPHGSSIPKLCNLGSDLADDEEGCSDDQTGHLIRGTSVA
jgi:hypothetical protein